MDTSLTRRGVGQGALMGFDFIKVGSGGLPPENCFANCV